MSDHLAATALSPLAFYLMKSGQLLGLLWRQVFQNSQSRISHQQFILLSMLPSTYELRALVCLILLNLLRTSSTNALLQMTALSFLQAIVTLRCMFSFLPNEKITRLTDFLFQKCSWTKWSDLWRRSGARSALHIFCWICCKFLLLVRS